MSNSQRLAVVPTPFLVEHLPHATLPEDDEWIALVRAPEGLTVIREAPHYAENDRWFGFYGGGTAHGLEATGMLAALVGPLAEARIPVFAASTYHADLVLVPERRLDDAVTALKAAGHEVSRNV
ncbi:ACT domain-containing protein [Actinomadura sp. HBU206391]|uniref:ACT domain-containing protein n=1 Tax=Actinomadura sp. HBU206391 TaxID=2731692 RepID=UPI00164FDC57|nr:ACT domain-containing protein [Actinomadura sp. HBU206391]MBC6461460.1 ACT domain-containing protein [Actinomadura sp. HBU206391]